MEIIVKGLEIDGNKQLQKARKFHKVFEKIILKYLSEMITGEVELLYHNTTIKNSTIKFDEKFDRIFFGEYLDKLDKKNNRIEKSKVIQDGKSLIAS